MAVGERLRRLCRARGRAGRLGPAVGAVEAPAAAKAALLVVIGLPLCWAVASLVRALPGVRKVL